MGFSIGVWAHAAKAAVVLAIVALLETTLLVGPARANPGIELFGEVPSGSAKYFCILREPFLDPTLNMCFNIEIEYTSNPNGLDLTNVGTTTLPGAASMAAAGAAITAFLGVTDPLAAAISAALTVDAASLLVAMGCGGFICSGSTVIRFFLSNPSAQNTIIGWSKPGGAIGSAGVLNSLADVRCARGEIVHLAITWDADIHLDLGPLGGPGTPPSVQALANAQNTSSDLISQPALTVELPVWDRAMFPNLSQIRGHQIVEICGRWVTDTNSDEGWNELHPVTALTILAGPDSDPPTITVPSSVVAEATSAAGATVTYAASASDTVDALLGLPAPIPSCSPASGSTFPLGATTVTCTATDRREIWDAANKTYVAAGNPGTASFNVVVQDTTPPETSILTAVDAIGTSLLSGASTLFGPLTIAFGGTDAVGVTRFECSVDGAAFATCASPFSGGAAVGGHSFQVRARDAAGNVDATPATFNWSVITPAQAADNLAATVAAMGLANGVESSLVGPLNKLAKIVSDADPTNDADACEKLASFTAKVKDWEAKGELSSAQAAQLRTLAGNIALKLGCP